MYTIVYNRKRSGNIWGLTLSRKTLIGYFNALVLGCARDLWSVVTNDEIP